MNPTANGPADASGEAGGTASGAEDWLAELELITRMHDAGADEFRLLGRRWHLAKDVFSPALSHGTAFFSSRLPFPAGGRFLEVGCGAGVTAVQAALAGCREVRAVDISPAAVDTTRRNAALHGAHAVRASISDVFADVAADEGFDLVFWNIPYVSLPEGHRHTSMLSRSFFDVGHQLCRAYFAGVRDHLAPSGSAYVGLGSITDTGPVERIAAGHGWRLRLVDSGAAEPDADIEHRLYRLADAKS